ncbi:MAG: hypothetical protein P8Y00_00010 [Deltaproteobacteria bacterium]
MPRTKESPTQYSMYYEDQLVEGSVQLGGDEPSLFAPTRVMSYEEVQSWEAGHTKAKVKLQKELCATVLSAHEAGILPMTNSEVAVVQAMEKSNKPIKDTHIAVLRALVERAK